MRIICYSEVGSALNETKVIQPKPPHMQGSKLRPFWSHMLPKCNLCDSKIYLGAFVRVHIIAVVRPLQFSAKRSRITAQHVSRDRELKQVKLFIRALV